MATAVEKIQNIVSQIARVAREDRITIQFDLHDPHIDLEIDVSLVEHDVKHLLNQLVSFTPENGNITVGVSRRSGNVGVLEFVCNGIDLHLYTGLTKGLVLPTLIFKNGHNSTRYELRLDAPKSEPAPQKSTPDIRSENNFYLEIQNRLRSHFNKAENLLDALKGNPAEAAFLKRVNNVIENNIAQPQLDVNKLAALMNMSRTQLFRKLKPIIRQSPSGYIRSLRLQRAKELLENSDYRVSEVAFLTGFETPSNFTKVFVKAFGVKPSALSRHKPDDTNGQVNATN